MLKTVYDLRLLLNYIWLYLWRPLSPEATNTNWVLGYSVRVYGTEVVTAELACSLSAFEAQSEWKIQMLKCQITQLIFLHAFMALTVKWLWVISSELWIISYFYLKSVLTWLKNNHVRIATFCFLINSYEINVVYWFSANTSVQSSSIW